MAVNLLMVDESFDEAATVVFGDAPALPAGWRFDWPVCAACGGPMCHLGQVPHPVHAGRRILLFQCGNEPGCCEDWEAERGANLAVVIPTDLALLPLQAPSAGLTALQGRWSGHLRPSDAETYDQAMSQVRAEGLPGRSVLGQLGGEPDWIQDDETPQCPACGQAMRLAAQLEEGPDYRTAMNFGGGCAYVFACDCPAATARFLWQCG